MTVYFVRCGEDGPVKIGFSKNPPSRIRDLQLSNPHNLFLIHLIENASKKDEQDIHKKFRHLRIRGEWFYFDEEMLTYFAETTPVISPDVSYDVFIKAWLDCFGSEIIDPRSLINHAIENDKFLLKGLIEDIGMNKNHLHPDILTAWLSRNENRRLRGGHRLKRTGKRWQLLPVLDRLNATAA